MPVETTALRHSLRPIAVPFGTEARREAVSRMRAAFSARSM
jgi:hypothetical protein